jgi:hypothetical protein
MKFQEKFKHLGSLYFKKNFIVKVEKKNVECNFYNTNTFICFPFNKPISKIINLSNNASLERK